MTDAAARLLADAYADHAPACRLYARSLSSVSPDADDAMAEAFVRLARRLAAGEAMPDFPLAWLLTAVRSAALDARKRARRRRSHESAAAFGGQMSTSPLFNPATSTAAGLDAAEAERALLRLPARQREVIALKLWCGLGFEAIAGLTGVGTSTAHREFAAGIEELRRLLGAKDDTP